MSRDSVKMTPIQGPLSCRATTQNYEGKTKQEQNIVAAAKAVYREFLYIIDDFEREKSGFSTFSGFLIFLIGFWAREGLENDPEPRGDVLTKFGPKRSHLDPV